MSRSGRIWVRILGVVLGVVLLGGVGLYLYFTPARLRHMLVPQLEASVKRPVALQQVSLSLWGGLAASVAGLEVKERPGFGQTPFLKADRASLNLAFWPLLSGRAKLGEIIIEGPEISVVIDENGTANYADLLETEAPGSAGRQIEPGPKRMVLPVDRVALLNGRLRYEDRQGEATTVLSGIDYHLQGGFSGDQIRLEGELSVEQVALFSGKDAPTQIGPLHLSHNLVLDQKEDALGVEALTVALGPLALRLTGRISDVSEVPDVTLRAEESLQLDRIGTYLADSGMLSSGARMAGEGQVSVRISGALDAEADPPVYPGVSAQIRLMNLFLSDSEWLLVPLESGEAVLTLEGDWLREVSLEGQVGRSDFAVTGQVRGLLDKRPYGTVSVTAGVLDLDEMLAVAPAQAASDNGSMWGLITPLYAASAPVADETSGLLWLLRTLDFDGKTQIGELKDTGTVYRKIHADLQARNRVLRVENLQATVYGGQLRARAELDGRNPGGPVPVQADVALERVQANGLVQEMLGWALPVYGQMGMTVSMSGAVDSTLELVEKEIRAGGSVDLEEGKIVNWNLLQKAFSSVSQLSFLQVEEIPIRGLVMPFQVADGRVYLKQMKLVAADLACRVNGSAGLDGSLDYTLDVDVPAAMLNVGGLNLGKALGAFLGGGQDATFPLRVFIGGTTERPQVKASMQPARNAQKQTPKNEKGEPLKKGSDLLRRFFQ